METPIDRGQDPWQAPRGDASGERLSGRTFEIVTLGCKVNAYESAQMALSLTGAGMRRPALGERPDLVVVNTCIVTGTAARQSRQALRKAVREAPEALVAGVGCYAQVFPSELEDIQGVRVIAGNTCKGKIALWAAEALGSGARVLAVEPFGSDTALNFQALSVFPERTRAFLKVQDGCEARCAYCIVPETRGPYRSLPPEEVLEAVRRLGANKYREIVLTGIHLGKYGVDLPVTEDLKGLLRRILDADTGVRIRLSSIEPLEIDGGLIRLVEEEPCLCRHFHIPLQSGDKGVLEAMGRHYAPGDFARIVQEIQERIPLAAIGTDLLAGFPGENARAFENTLALVSELPLAYLHVFPFSPRPGTPAALLAHRVEASTLKGRTEALRRLGKEKRRSFYGSSLGGTFTLLVETWDKEAKGTMRGSTDTYLPIRFVTDRDRTGEFVRIRATGHWGDGVRGDLVPGSSCDTLDCAFR